MVSISGLICCQLPHKITIYNNNNIVGAWSDREGCESWTGRII